MANYISYKSPIGILYITADNDGVTEISTIKPSNKDTQLPTLLSVNCVNALFEYFNGERREFSDIAISPNIKGTDFQKRVWNALNDIPFGATASYAQIAIAAGSPRGFRAVGNANHNNPVPIIVPCHRVIGTNGTLTGYGLGLDAKKYLLDLEQKFLNKENKL